MIIPVLNSELKLNSIIKIDRTGLLGLNTKTSVAVKDAIDAIFNYSADLNKAAIIRYHMAKSLTNTFSDYIHFVASSEKEGTRMYKDTVTEICRKFNLGTLSIGTDEIIYDEDKIRAYFELNEHSEKTYAFKIVVDEDLADDIKAFIMERKAITDTPVLNRLSLDSRGYMSEDSILFNAPKINVPAELMYPYLDKSPEEYAQEFLDSTANVMVLYGDPGTGKTTFIKRMLKAVGFSDEQSISVVDTPGVMESSELVNKLYLSKHKDVFVFEDVDRHLYSRKEGNDIMAGLLNAAEGLASPGVKMVISTNIKNLSDIDSALIRPGRCYKTLKFEKLSEDQQVQLREFIGLSTDSCTTQYRTLAEVMNEKATEHEVSFGFNLGN